MIHSGRSGPMPVLEVADVPRHERRDVGIQDGRGGALELAKLGQDLGREGDRQAPAACGRSPMRCSCSGWAKEKSRHTASDSAPAASTWSSTRSISSSSRGLMTRAVRRHALGHCEAQVVRRGCPTRREREPVEARPGLPADRENVAKAAGRDKSGRARRCVRGVRWWRRSCHGR